MAYDLIIPWPDYPFHRHSDKRATTENVERFRATVQESASNAGLTKVITDQVSITCRFFPRGNQDLDNIVKPLLDALSGIVYRNDNQVAELHAFLWSANSPNPRMEVTIETLDGMRYLRYLVQAGSGNELNELSQMIQGSTKSQPKV